MEILDCTLIKSKDEFWHEYLQISSIEGAQYFGKNLDALWDALTAGGPGHPKDLSELTLANSNALKAIDNGVFHKKLLSIAQDLQACNHTEFVLHMA